MASTGLWYHGAPSSTTFGQLTQTATGTYTSTRFVPGTRDLISESDGPTRRSIPVTVDFVIKKGTGAVEVSNQLNAILGSAERPSVTLVGGTPERIKAVWFHHEMQPITCMDGSHPMVDPSQDNLIAECISDQALLFGNARQTAYTEMTTQAVQWTALTPIWKQLPPRYYNLGSTRPLEIKVPKRCTPIVYLNGDPLPTGNKGWADVSDLNVSIFYGYLECDAAVSSAFNIGDASIGGFWDWAAKIINIVIKIAEIVLPLVEALAQPAPSVTDSVTLHPRWASMDARERSATISQLHRMYSVLSQTQELPSVRSGKKRTKGKKKGNPPNSNPSLPGQTGANQAKKQRVL